MADAHAHLEIRNAKRISLQFRDCSVGFRRSWNFLGKIFNSTPKQVHLLGMWQYLINNHEAALLAAGIIRRGLRNKTRQIILLWKDMILRGDFEEIRSWSYARGNTATGRHSFNEPWNTYFMQIGIIPGVNRSAAG